jgi:hypothetical protein
MMRTDLKKEFYVQPYLVGHDVLNVKTHTHMLHKFNLNR